VSGLYVGEAGHGSPALVLLHGLGVNGAVWDRLIALLAPVWPGRILAPDLRGHGRSPHERPYGFGQHAADVAALVASEREPIAVVGHSMGGAIGLVLATGWFGVEVASVFAFGVKVRWTEDDLGKMRAFGQSQTRWFETRDEAVTRFLRVAGLEGLVEPTDSVVHAGIVAENGRYRLAADNATVLAGPLDMAVLKAIPSRVTLACGSNDGVVAIDELRVYDRDALELANVGHNAHVENPALLRDEIVRLTRGGAS
jgi:pimeloyl-ACP methyl ester carboxylesterase